MWKRVLPKSYVFPNAEQYQLISKRNRHYQLLVSVPTEKPPANGYPVIYLLDGNAFFATAAEAVRLQSRRPEKTEVAPTIVVGIGYPTEVPFSSERFYDFTVTKLDKPLSTNFSASSATNEVWGGGEQFLAFIDEELKPWISSKYYVDATKQALLGHSLGGLFVLYSLFLRPDSFQTFIAGSPSIHLNKEPLFKKASAFIQELKKKSINARLLIGYGELEKHQKWHAVNDGKDMVEHLSSYQDHGLQVKFIEFAEENHISVLAPLINSGLRFANN